MVSSISARSELIRKKPPDISLINLSMSNINLYYIYILNQQSCSVSTLIARSFVSATMCVLLPASIKVKQAHQLKELSSAICASDSARKKKISLEKKEKEEKKGKKE